MSERTLLLSRRMWIDIGLLGSLYLSQGLPYGFFTQALPVMMREQGYSLKQIGLSSLLVLPWALKFLWAPLVDRHGSSRFGRRRSWIVPLQLASALLLIAAGLYDSGGNLRPLLVVIFLVNLLSATQDIATDGLAVDRLDVEERGVANGIQVAGYRFGMILGGGVLLIIHEQVGWTWTFVSMGLLILVASGPALLMREREHAAAPKASLETSGRAPLRPSLLFDRDHFLRQPGAWRLLALIVGYKLGDAFAVGMIRPFLSDAGLTLSDIGWLLGTVGFTGGLLGALTGGALVNPLGRRRALLFFGLLQMLTVMGYALVARGTVTTQDSASSAGAAIDPVVLFVICGIEHFASGMATAALFTAMMDWCRPQANATDYTVQASAVVIATGAASTVSGYSAEALGYFGHFLLATGLSLVSVLLVVAFFPAAKRPQAGVTVRARGT